jgi:hypothetical protein
VLTRSWTVAPENLEMARRQWEYSHAINAGFVLLALVLIVSAVLASSYDSGMANRATGSLWGAAVAQPTLPNH